MASADLHEAVLENLPGGLIVIDPEGTVLVVNRAAKKILGLPPQSFKGNPCKKLFSAQPAMVDVLMGTTKHLSEVNRKEMRIANLRGERIVLGYGTLVFRSESGSPLGVGMTFQDITPFVPVPLHGQFISLINLYFIPFTFAMVIAALIWGLAEAWEKTLAIAVLLGLAAFNYFVAWQVRRARTDMLDLAKLHTPANFLAMGLLVYLLGTLWGPMWLLFVLTPLAASLYATRTITLATSVTSAVVLLGIYDQRGLTGTIGWAQAFLHALFIVLISLFVHSLAALVERVRSGRA
ncbi:MAG: PAS domain S-box protein [Elusimicrobia bacterium]|nr:PAS domain S-box protein [Elusimicrobiota bacterium]